MQRTVNSHTFSRTTNHDNARIVQKESAHGLLVDFQPFRDLSDGQTSFVDIDRDFHVDSPERLRPVPLARHGLYQGRIPAQSSDVWPGQRVADRALSDAP